jgi:hypothetical protein
MSKDIFAGQTYSTFYGFSDGISAMTPAYKTSTPLGPDLPGSGSVTLSPSGESVLAFNFSACEIPGGVEVNLGLDPLAKPRAQYFVLAHGPLPPNPLTSPPLFCCCPLRVPPHGMPFVLPAYLKPVHDADCLKRIHVPGESELVTPGYFVTHPGIVQFDPVTRKFFAPTTRATYVGKFVFYCAGVCQILGFQMVCCGTTYGGAAGFDGIGIFVKPFPCGRAGSTGQVGVAGVPIVFDAPPGDTTANVLAWARGGSAGHINPDEGSFSAPGGGGGGFAFGSVPVTGGHTYNTMAFAPDAYFTGDGGSTVLARQGQSAPQALDGTFTPGLGGGHGPGGANIGDTTNDGGDGAPAGFFQSSGGGGAGSADGRGGDASGVHGGKGGPPSFRKQCWLKGGDGGNSDNELASDPSGGSPGGGGAGSGGSGGPSELVIYAGCFGITLLPTGCLTPVTPGTDSLALVAFQPDSCSCDPFRVTFTVNVAKFGIDPPSSTCGLPSNFEFQVVVYEDPTLT